MKNYRLQKLMRTTLCAFLYISTALVQASTHVSLKGRWLPEVDKGAASLPPTSQSASSSLKDSDRYVAAVARNGLALQYVPKQAIDRDLCLAAVAQNGSALEFVPNAFKEKSICRAAIGSNRSALKWVPKELQPWASRLVVLEDLRARRSSRLLSSSHQEGVADKSETGIPSKALKEAILLASLIQLYCSQYR